MGFAGSIGTCLQKYADSQGRASRAEFNGLMIPDQLAVVAHYVLVAVAPDRAASPHYLVLTGILSLLFVLPLTAVSVRRVQDLGWSEWWAAILFVPVAGNVFAIVLMLKRGMPGANGHGPAPAEERAGATALALGGWSPHLALR